MISSRASSSASCPPRGAVRHRHDARRATYACALLNWPKHKSAKAHDALQLALSMLRFSAKESVDDDYSEFSRRRRCSEHLLKWHNPQCADRLNTPKIKIKENASSECFAYFLHTVLNISRPLRCSHRISVGDIFVVARFAFIFSD